MWLVLSICRDSSLLSLCVSFSRQCMYHAGAHHHCYVSWCLTGLGDDKSEREETDSSQSESEHGNYVDRADIGPPVETSYVSCVGEELGQVCNAVL